MKSFHKLPKSLNTTYGCSPLEFEPNGTNIANYETRYNGVESNNRARANWRDFQADLECLDESFLCGLEMNMDGKYEIDDVKRSFEVFNDENKIDLEEQEDSLATKSNADSIQ